ncbi:unnamed protein product [Danaus chrysippus]|uniref:(African queen) hypothetical protein n=1 Tax=Danaus chrysippus TaxID=151541 RepID=A0A8J2QWK2_9NEOP|nr:unnamed protein product [Danaus chrysippus]
MLGLSGRVGFLNSRLLATIQLGCSRVKSFILFDICLLINADCNEMILMPTAQEIITKLRQFKVPVHPRIRLFFQLLKKAMLDHAQRNADTLYNPNVYNELKDNAT